MLKKVGAKLDFDSSTIYTGADFNPPKDAKNGDIYIQTDATTPPVKINVKDCIPFNTSWFPITTWSTITTTTFNADDYTPKIFGRSFDEIFDLIKKEEELQRENKHLKEVLKVYEQMELANETNKTV